MGFVFLFFKAVHVPAKLKKKKKKCIFRASVFILDEMMVPCVTLLLHGYKIKHLRFQCN